jgi:hypothetical protein
VAVADTAPPTGTPATVSADVLPTWQINGVVWAQVLVGNTVYVTGSFTKARPPGVSPGGAGEVNALNIFAYDITTGNRVTSFSHSLNAQGRAITASPDGTRVYVGGDFTTVDGISRQHVAAFLTATKALDSSFRPSVNGAVKALAATNTTAYIGGLYSTVNGSARRNLSAVSPNSSGGSLLSWAPRADYGTASGAVEAMVMTPDQRRVIVGGRFTTLNGQSANGMGSVDASNGAQIHPWAANQNIRNGGDKSGISNLRTDGQQIFGVGWAFGSGNFEGTFAANPYTGAITVVNDCHGDTYDVFPIGSVLYSVGHAHDCRWIRSFPDTSPRVRWQRALAQTIAPKTTNIGPDNYGWNYNGLPASAVLQWYPDLPSGSYTGQYQGPWTITGNSTYIVMGGEFPKVNGVAQQGLVRMAVKGTAPNKRGPIYDTKPPRPVPETTATSPSQGRVTVTFGTAWDYDNELLTYELYRNSTSTPIYTTKIKTNFWTVPSATFTDTGLASGSSQTYQVKIIDPLGNSRWSPKSSAVIVK